MSRRLTFRLALSPLAIVLASCGASANGDSGDAPSATAAPVTSVKTESYGSFDQPWAAAFAPGTSTLFITEKPGTMRFIDTVSRRTGIVTGTPNADPRGQGGLGDIAFLTSEANTALNRRTIYLTWAEGGPDGMRGAALGRGTLVCEQADACRIDGLKVIWRQLKQTGYGHYSHRIAFSPDGQYLFLSSGDRQKMEPAQDTANNLGSIVRLNLDGTPAPENAFAGQAGKAQDIWSYGHRNVLGLQFDAQGRLWGLEHGPAGGDELNRIHKGTNYGWPLVSDGDHYDGRKIPRHATSDAYAKPAISWNPVIAPGDFLFYHGRLFTGWSGQAIVAAMDPAALVRVEVDGETAREVERITMDKRVREIVEDDQGVLWVLEDGKDGRLLRLTPG